jgi:hypothetical protein
MNILFMIGNGFDLNLGLKTSYNDFYSYYKSKNTKNDKVKKLKEHISSNFENWSDLEFALGAYTKSIKTAEEFDEIFDDIGNNLAEYLSEEEKRLDFNHEKTNRNKLFDYLKYPENSLIPIDENNLKIFREKYSSTQLNTNIITFNYTKSLEKLLNYSEQKINISGATISYIHHIHGYLDNRMIMGVNDISQIENKAFHDNLNITEALIKHKCNEVCGHTIDNQCEKLIQSAQLVCIFGSSLGDTDKLWWDLIAQQLIKNDFKLIIFEKVDDIPLRQEYKKERIRRDKKNNFLNRTTLTAEEKEIAKENIFIGVNTDLFTDIYDN